MIWKTFAKFFAKSFAGLILLVLSLFLLSKAAVTWVQYSPEKSTELISKWSGVETKYDNLQIQHTWTGFELNANNLKIHTEQLNFSAESLKLDLNLFNLLSPGLPVGESLSGQNLELKTFNSLNNSVTTRSGSNDLLVEKIYKILSKTWRQVSIADLSLQAEQAEDYRVLISSFNSQKLDSWQILSNINVSKNEHNLANFVFEADLELGTFSRLKSGNFSLIQQGSSSIETISVIWPLAKDLVAKFESGSYELVSTAEVENYQLKTAKVKSQIKNLQFNLAGNQLNLPSLAINIDRVNQGHAKLSLDFLQPVEFITELSEQKHYQIVPNQIWLLDFQAADASWALTEPASFLLNGVPATLKGSGDFTGGLDLSLTAEIEDIHFLKHHFLPYPMMEDALVDWLKNSLVGGHSIKAETILKGRLQDFPFTDKPGEFYARAVMQDSELKFNPEWPSIKDFVALVEFRPFDLTISSDHGKIFAADAHNIVVNIDNLHSKNVAVEVKAHAFSESQNALNFLLASPLAKHSGMEALLQGNLSGTGRLRVDLEKLFIPVLGFEGRDIEVLGKVSLSDKLKLVNLIELDNLAGDLWFSENSLWTKQPIKTKFYKGEHQVSVKTDLEVKNVLVESVGSIYINDYGFAGKVPVKSKTIVPFGDGLLNEVKVEVDLEPKELASEWPSPLDKKTLSNRLKVLVDINAGKEIYQLKLADELHLDLQFLEAKNGTDKTGVRIGGFANSLDLDAWFAFKDQLTEIVSFDFASSEKSSGAEPQSIYWLASNFKINQPVFLKQAYKPLNLNWQTFGKQLQLKATSPEIDLRLTYVADPEPKIVINTDLLQIKLEENEDDNESFLQVKNTSSEAGSCSVLDKKSWPQIEFKGRNVLLGSRMLNELQFDINTEDKGWFIDNAKFTALNNSAHGTASYKFSHDSSTSQLKLDISSSDVAALTNFFGVRQGFRGEKANFNLDLNWPGDLSCFSTKNWSGIYKGKFRDGVIEEVEPGLARIIGLLSVDSIVRRLKLDLKDVTNKGMEYSKVNISGRFDNKFYYLDNLEVNSPGVKLESKGKVKADDFTLDLEAQVTPAVGSTLPVLAGILGFANPVTGLMAYLLAKGLPFINEDLITYNYQVSGDLEDPELKMKGASVIFK